MNKDKWIQVGLGLALILLGIFATTQFFAAKKYKNQSLSFKEEMIRVDTVKMVDQGYYKKLVDDLNTQKQLYSELKDQNATLAQQLKKQGKKPIIVTEIQQTFESRVDTIIIDKTKDFFEDFYPDDNDWYVNYQSYRIGDSLRVGAWDFSTIDIDLVISEKQKGLYEADIQGPKFLKINDLQVKSLPLEEIKPDNFGWLIGGGGSYNIANQQPNLHLSGGVRFKKTSFIINGSTNSSVGLTILREL